MNKLTLIVDGNWLLNSRMAIMMNRFEKTNPESDRIAAQAELSDFMARSIVVTLNKIPIIDNVVIVADGGSWRKKLPVPQLAKDITYKGNRVLSVEYDWDRIFESLNEVQSRCQELGITYCRYTDIEGDDWCWYWSRRLNQEGINCLIWSVDNDLKQLIQCDGGAFTAWYCNDKTGLFLHKDLQEPEYENDLDFFLTPYSESSLLSSLRKYTGKTTYLDPDSIVLTKIMCGDGGDNIKSIIRYTKNGRNRRLSEKEWEKLSKFHKIYKLSDLEDLGRKETILIRDLVEKYSKVNHNIDYQNVKEMLEYNKKLVYLNEKMIPENLISKMNEIEYKQFDISYIRNNYKVLTKQNSEIENIFDGIEF